jgi:EAL domain-containing protein (putative c-di-GMP-specific phosphodiesterase class I)
VGLRRPLNTLPTWDQVLSYALNPELKVAASAALLQRGCVNLIKFDAIKAEAGRRWEKIGSAVAARLESLLRQKLGPADFFVGVDDTTVLVSMPSSDAESSQVLCLRVAHELHTSFLGPCKITQLQIARAVELKDDRIEIADIKGDSLIRLAMYAGVDCGNEILPSLPEVPPRAARTASGSEAPAFLEMFVPLWDAQKEAITAYRCITTSSPSVGLASATRTQFKVDLGATLSRIQHAAHSLARHLEVGDRFLVFIAISYDVLSSPIGRMEIASACRGLSSHLRPYLIFEISDLPYGAPQSRLLELVGALRPFCRAVAGQLPARVASYGTYQSAGLAAIGLSLTANGAGSTDTSSEVRKLCAAAKRLHVMSFVWDVVADESACWAREQGVNFVSGPVIGPPVDEPSSVRRLTAAEISARRTEYV